MIKKYIQKLKGFIALCDMYHHVKHIGLAGILASKGKLDYEKVIEHFMKVNKKCDRITFERHKEKTFEQWRKRDHEWQVDLREYNKNRSKSSSNYSKKIKLKDAVELYKQEERSPSNSFILPGEFKK